MIKGKYNITTNYKYTTPVVYKDPANKKWCGRYTIIYHGEKAEYRKEYFKEIGGINRIEDLKEREIQITFLCEALDEELAVGIDNVRVAEAKIILHERVEVLNQFKYENVINEFLIDLKYDNPEKGSKYYKSSRNYKNFFNNTFHNFFKENYPQLLLDVRKIERKHVYEFLREKYIIEKVWAYSSMTTYKGWVSALFKNLEMKQVVNLNPTTGIIFKKNVGNVENPDKYAVYSKEEIGIIFKYLVDNSTVDNERLELFLKILYYVYIRQEEMLRLKTRNFDLVDKKISVYPEEAKRQTHGNKMDVLVQERLLECVKRFLGKYPIKDQELVFGNPYNKEKPMEYDYFYLHYNKMIAVLKVKHPKLFQKDLTMYSFKHAGITHYIEVNMTKGHSSILLLVQKQCRHTSLTTTEKYMKDLKISLEIFEDFQEL